MAAEEVKKIGGLRFEVFQRTKSVPVFDLYDSPWQTHWHWRLVGAEGVVCESPSGFLTEKQARSHISANRGRLKAAGRSKVFTVDG